MNNHGRVLLCIAADPQARLRDIAEAIGVTERSAYAVVHDLTRADYIVKHRDGRRIRYSIAVHLPLPDRAIGSQRLSDVQKMLVDDRQ